MSPKILGVDLKEFVAALLRQHYLRDISRQKQADIFWFCG